MAYYFLFPESDTTLYSHPDRKDMNTGGDEILEILKERGTTDAFNYPSRILIKFKDEEIKETIDLINRIDKAEPVDNFNDGTSTVSLQLSSTEAKKLVATNVLELFAVSQSWNEGRGRYLNNPTGSTGATWSKRDNSINATSWATSSFAQFTTGSISSSQLTQGGGVWYTGSEFISTQQFLVGETLDTDINVTSIIQKFSSSIYLGQTYPTGILNNGFLIKQPDSIESNVSSTFGELSYFSVNTHTIYPPKLCFKWDDSVYQSGQFDNDLIKKKGELSVTLYRNKQEYNQNDEALIRIHVRDKYPTRSFTTSSNFIQPGYFNSTSYYSIRDAHTEREIIPFDTKFSKLSADAEGMYFKLYMKGFQPERYYRILFKHINNDGTTVYDDNYFFKVIR